jgi:MFS family permease
MNQHDARWNLRLIQIFRVFNSAMVSIPVIVPFFNQNGLNQTEIFLLQSAFAAAVLLLEVPSGWFADHFGRKKSLVLGSLLATVGMFMYSQAFGFWPMLAAEMVLGLGASFISGADSALAYDSLASVGKVDKYRKFESRSMLWSSLSEAAAGIAGGFLAASSLRNAFWANVFTYAMLVPVALLLKEPARQRLVGARNAFKDVLRVTKYVLHGHKEIKWLVFYGAVTGVMTHTMFWLTQPYYASAGLPLELYGLLWTLQFGAIALASLAADRFEKLGRKFVLVSFVAMGVSGYLLLGAVQVWWMLPAMALFYFVRAVSDPVLKDYINRLVESDVRATVLSVKSLVQRLLFIGAGPLIGYFMDAYSLQTALLFSALFYGVLGAVTLLAMRRAKLM